MLAVPHALLGACLTPCMVTLVVQLVGSTGTLIGIDGLDGIVKMAANSDIKILDLELCAKLGDGLA